MYIGEVQLIYTTGRGFMSRWDLLSVTVRTLAFVVDGGSPVFMPSF